VSVYWLVGLVVRALDSQLDGCVFDSWLLRLVLGWVIIFERTNHLSILPGQLSLLPSVEWEMSTSQCGDALQLGSKSRYVSFHLWINMWVAGKTL